MLKIKIFFCFLILLCNCSEDNKVNLKYWLISCASSSCSNAFNTCMNCFGEKACRKCIKISEPDCSTCANDIYNSNDLQSINGNSYLFCDSFDPVQTKVCHFFCRGQLAQSGQCVRENNLPICKCSSEINTTNLLTDSLSTQATSKFAQTTSQSNLNEQDTSTTTLSTQITSKLPQTTLKPNLNEQDTSITTQSTQITTKFTQTTTSSNLPLVYFNGIVKLNFSIYGTGNQRILPLPNGDLVRGSYGNKIEIWDIERRIIKRNLPSSYSYPYILGLLSNGDLVAGYKTNSVIQIWDLKVANAESLKRTFQTNELFRCLTVLKNDDLAIGQSGNGFDIIIRSSQNGNLNRKLTGHTNTVFQIIELPNGNLASCSDDKTVKIWNTSTGSLLNTINHTSLVRSIALLKNGYLVSGLYDGTINIWNLETKILVRNLVGHTASICDNNCLFVLSNNDLLSGSWDNSLKVWNTVDGRVKISSTYHTYNVGQLAILPSGNFISESSAEINVWK